MVRACDIPPYLLYDSASAQVITIQHCMEAHMRDILLQCSGAVASRLSMLHGVLGETKVFCARHHRAAAAAHPDPAGVGRPVPWRGSAAASS